MWYMGQINTFRLLPLGEGLHTRARAHTHTYTHTCKHTHTQKKTLCMQRNECKPIKIHSQYTYY